MQKWPQKGQKCARNKIVYVAEGERIIHFRGGNDFRTDILTPIVINIEYV
jgi:hypothetical protein